MTDINPQTPVPMAPMVTSSPVVATTPVAPPMIPPMPSTDSPAPAISQMATLPQYSVPGPAQGTTKYQQLMTLIEDMGKDIRPAYTGNKICAERLKRVLVHARILARECIMEADRDRAKQQTPSA